MKYQNPVIRGFWVYAASDNATEAVMRMKTFHIRTL